MILRILHLLHSPSPFLFLGSSQESDHLRDYAAAVEVMLNTGGYVSPEPLAATQTNERELKRLPANAPAKISSLTES